MASATFVLLLSGALAAQAPAASAQPRGPVELVLWHSYSGAEQKVFEGLVAEWTAGHPEVRVTALPIPYDAFADKLTSAIGVGKGPDLFVFAHDRLGGWASQGLVEPIQHYLDAAAVDRFFPSALSALTFPQGSRMLYGLPLAMKSLALIYDRSKVPQPPRTLDELKAEARRLTDVAGYGLVFDWANTYSEAGFLHAFGGAILDPAGRPALDSAGNAAALGFVRTLRDEGLLPREVTGAMVTSMFNDGKAAMIVAGPWVLHDLEKSGRPIGVAPLPAGPAGPARPYLGVEALILSARSAHKSEAMALMLALTDDAGAKKRLAEAGQPVANRRSWAGSEDAALQGFRAQAELAIPMPTAPAMRHVWTPVDAALAKAIARGEDAAGSLAEAQKRVVANVEVSDRDEPVEVVAKGAEEVLEKARAQAADPERLLPEGRFEAMVLKLESQGPGPLGRWCSAVQRGFAKESGCQIDQALANLADLADAKAGPALAWNADKTEVTAALRAADGRVALVRGGAPVRQADTWRYVLGALLAALAVLALVYRRELAPHLGAYAYVFPAIASVVVLVFLPFGYGLSLAFYDVTPTRERFVGLTNFLDIILARSQGDAHSFYFTLGMTALWTVVNVTLHVAIGLALALVLQDPKLRFRNVYRVLLIIPWAIPNYITALIWKAMFNAEYGLINRVFGLQGFSWFDHPVSAFFANLATNVWLGFPFMMVTALGALQSIPRELYEAADVDGAGRWRKFSSVTLPLLKPALIPAIILGTIWTFNLSFNVIYLVSGGMPDGATDILVTQAFRYAFEQYRYGYAAAYATIIFVILLGYTLITNRITKATEGAFE